MSFKEIQDLFINKGLTIGSIESFTGGLFAKEVTSVPGASGYYKGTIVTYATSEKERLLGISHDDVVKYGVVSKEIAEQMAVYGRDLLDVDVCVSFTGNAGPDAMEGKPVGEVYIGISSNEKTEVFPQKLKGNRFEIQSQAVEIAKELLKNF
ncbi:MAG: CinA family protein [Bacilli bacterium]|nr:CinA family protein [Bacilli bacterium]